MKGGNTDVRKGRERGRKRGNKGRVRGKRYRGKRGRVIKEIWGEILVSR